MFASDRLWRLVDLAHIQRGYKLLIIGASILATGLILTASIFLIFKQTSFYISASIDTISPGKSVVKTSGVSAGTNMAIAITSKPPNNEMNLQIIEEPSLTKLLDVNFTGTIFTNFMPKKNGTDTIMISNIGPDQATMNIVFGNRDFFDPSGQPIIILATLSIAGLLLSFVGIVVLNAGGVILFVDKRRIRRKENQN